MVDAAKPENVRAVLFRMWSYLGRYWSRLVIVSLLVAGSTGLGLLGPALTRRAIDGCIAPGRMEGLATVVGLMIACSILSAAFAWMQTIIMVRVSQETLLDIRRDLFRRLQALPLRFFDSHPHGEVMSRITNDTEAINSALANTVIQLVGCVLGIVGAGAAMVAMNWRFAIVAVATTPLVFALTRWIAKASREEFRQRQEDLGVLNGLIEETITGQRVVRAFRGERRAIADFEGANSRLRRSATRAAIVAGAMGPFMNLSRNIAFAILACAGGWMVLRQWVTVGTVAAFLSYAEQFSRPINALASLWASVQFAIAGAERVFAIMDEPPEPEDPPDAAALVPVRGDVTFDHVDFGYLPEQPVLRDVTFHAQAGQTIALVGPTGAGKTTIINLLTRFYDVGSGSILIDGCDIRHVRRDELRRALGVVLQDTFVFADTVRGNIRYGRLDATDEEIEEAARLANADGFIRHLPHGLDTPLSEAGGSLSQGQRQLLAIARAVLADPAILILDEATSSVDTRTEIHIQEAMRRLMRGRTAFVIAHRLATVRQADCILVIDGGRVVEQGSHAELMAARGAYWQLHELQFGNVVQAAPQGSAEAQRASG
ncbi:MAG TPA: ABC transporter ATP-binding protein [Armatimonadota bacterium]|nr:ABC transporter ATP-binding protein [Armatimonadota bacterium]